MRRYNWAWLRASRFTTLFACGAGLFAAVPAFASDPLVAIAVTPNPTTVSVSRTGLDTFFSHQVSVTNNSTNTINNVRFVAMASVVNPASTSATATFVQALGASCTADTTNTTVTCSIGQLTGGGGTGANASFVVVWKAPSSGTSVNLAWTTYYGEGSNDSSNASHIDTTVGTASTGLVTSTSPEIKKGVQTLITTQGGTFFTGIYTPAGAAATLDDPWTTTVTVPPINLLATAQITETEDNTISCAPDLLTCNVSVISIPGVTANLVFTLRRDASTIAKGAKIASAVIYYDAPQHPDPRITYPMQVLNCTDTTWGTLPQSGIPCIYSRTAYPDKSTPSKPVPAGFEGDWEFVIHARDNGSYRN